MKKQAILALLATLAFGGAYADNNANVKFGPHAFVSSNASQVITIQDANSDLQTYDVEIYVDFQGMTGGSTPPYIRTATGVNVKNCGSVTHINAGSSALCQISSKNPVITFSSDSNDKDTVAWGTFQYNQ